MSLRLYESIFILSPQTSSEKIDEIVEKIEGMIRESDGTVLRTEKWGLKKLAYLVKKFNEGFYLYFLFEAIPGTAREIESKLKFEESIIRFLSVKVEKARDADLRREAEEKAKQPAEESPPAPAPAKESIKERLSKVKLGEVGEEKAAEENSEQEEKEKAGQEEVATVQEPPPENEEGKSPTE